MIKLSPYTVIPLTLATLATVSTVTHAATPVLGGSANYELLYGGAISNETPKVYAEIPVETKDLATTLENHIATAVEHSGNLVMPIPEMEGATLVRAHTIPDAANPADVMIRVGGVDIDDVTSDFDISIEASGDSGQVGRLDFVAFKDAAVIAYNINESRDNQYTTTGRVRFGANAPIDWALSVSSRSPVGHGTKNAGPDFNSNEWSNSLYTASPAAITNGELFSLVYSADMELIFPETDYPDQWSAVLDIEMEVL